MSRSGGVAILGPGASVPPVQTWCAWRCSVSASGLVVRRRCHYNGPGSPFGRLAQPEGKGRAVRNGTADMGQVLFGYGAGIDDGKAPIIEGYVLWQ